MTWRRAWLVPEGWYYIAVLSFIFGGAVLRNVNLLVALAGLMLAPVLLNWRLAVTSLRGLQLRRRLPERGTAGQTTTVELQLYNRRLFYASWLITVDDQLVHEGATREAGSQTSFRKTALQMWNWLFRRASHADAVVTRVPPRGNALSSYGVLLSQRGLYRFGPLRVSTRFPLGLVACSMLVPQFDELLVWPWLGRLDPDWLRLLGGGDAGSAERAPLQSFNEGDYYGLRPWRSGDSRRWIHWRTTARLQTPMVRQFERQQEREAALVLDAWLPADPTPADHERLEAAISFFATALTELARQGGATVGVAVAGTSGQTWVGSANSIQQELLDHLALLRGAEDPPLSAAVADVRRLTPSAPCVLIVTSRGGRSGQHPSPGEETSTSEIVVGCNPAAGIDIEGVRWVAADAPEFAALYSLS
jgi:uncharacterized protein (DUF58 family)